jgi:hypothetical protein
VRGYGKLVREKLDAAGCQFIRHGRGDHDVWESPINGKRFTVPVNIDSRRKQDHEGLWPPKGILSGKRPPRHGIKLDSRANTIVRPPVDPSRRASQISLSNSKRIPKVANLGVRLVTRCRILTFTLAGRAMRLRRMKPPICQRSSAGIRMTTCSDKRAVRVLMHRRGAQRSAPLYALRVVRGLTTHRHSLDEISI